MTTPFWGLYEDLPPPSTGAPSVPSSPVPPTTPNTPSSTDTTSEWVTGKNMKLVSPALRKKATMIEKKTPQNAQSKKHTSSVHTKEVHTPEAKVIHSHASSQISALSTYADELEGEEYDPARPNDYEQYLIDKSQQAREEREREREQEREDRERVKDIEKQPEREKEPAKLDLHISGEEAFMRRARLSGRAAPTPSHSPPRAQQDAGDEEDIDGMPWDSSAKSAPKQNQAPRKTLSVAERMMAKMGWKEGSGLGKSEQGITAPLQHKKTDRKSGIIVAAPTPPPKRPSPSTPATAGPPPTKAKTVTSIPSDTTRVLLLCNMVGPGEVDEDLESETASECTKYGEVSKCHIHELQGVPAEEAVRIFVEFQRSEAALKAFIDLNGRYFGGRVVSASFYDEDKFHDNNFEYTKH